MNPKHKLFCELYVSGLNASKAYIKAGYSQKNADPSASRLLRNDKICQFIKELQQKHSEIAMLSKEKLLNKISIQIENVDFVGLDTIKLIEIYNKMTGYNQPEKVEHSGEFTMKGLLNELRNRKK